MGFRYTIPMVTLPMGSCVYVNMSKKQLRIFLILGKEFER